MATLSEVSIASVLRIYAYQIEKCSSAIAVNQKLKEVIKYLSECDPKLPGKTSSVNQSKENKTSTFSKKARCQDDTDLRACTVPKEERNPIVRIENLSFSYKSSFETNEDNLALRNVSLEIRPKQRILLVGANGSGKSSLLRCLSGNHLSRFDKFEVDGKECKSNSALPWADQFRGLAYLGGVWRRSGGFNVLEAYARDIAVKDMMLDWQNEFPERRDVLVKVLGINMNWRMHQVSDGQRKKVRIMLKLLRPFKLCVIDEFLPELDLMSRKRFFDYLSMECEERGAAIIYATHVYDSPQWATHIAFVQDKTLSKMHKLDDFQPYQQLIGRGELTPMYKLVLFWLTKESNECLVEGKTDEAEPVTSRAYMPYDSGYEAGRSSELWKVISTSDG
mmetsp:Transcript_893/g.1088  ORF Transcript_893/g.1088 Transcript_893/m.1088 type:complete len:392 (-) Transcript_893:377-1552(-)